MDNAGLLSKVVEAVAAAQCGSEKGQVRTGKWGTDPRGGTDLEGGHRPRAEATDSGGGAPSPARAGLCDLPIAPGLLHGANRGTPLPWVTGFVVALRSRNLGCLVSSAG